MIGDHQIEVATFECFDKSLSSGDLPYMEIEVFPTKLAYDLSAVVLVVVDDKSAQRAVYGITSGAACPISMRMLGLKYTISSIKINVSFKIW